jgi:hypothetical protein
MQVVPDVLKEGTALILKGKVDQNTFFWNVGNNSPNDDVSHAIRPEFPPILALEVIPVIFFFKNLWKVTVKIVLTFSIQIL